MMAWMRREREREMKRQSISYGWRTRRACHVLFVLWDFGFFRLWVVRMKKKKWRGWGWMWDHVRGTCLTYVGREEGKQASQREERMGQPKREEKKRKGMSGLSERRGMRPDWDAGPRRRRGCMGLGLAWERKKERKGLGLRLLISKADPICLSFPLASNFAIYFKFPNSYKYTKYLLKSYSNNLFWANIR